MEEWIRKCIDKARPDLDPRYTEHILNAKKPLSVVPKEVRHIMMLDFKRFFPDCRVNIFGREHKEGTPLKEWVTACVTNVFPGMKHKEVMAEHVINCLSIKSSFPDASVPGHVDYIWHELILSDNSAYFRFFPLLEHNPFTEKTEKRVKKFFREYFVTYGYPDMRIQWIWEVEGLDFSQRRVYFESLQKEPLKVPACLLVTAMGPLLGHRCLLPLQNQQRQDIGYKKTFGELCNDQVVVFEKEAILHIKDLNKRVFSIGKLYLSKVSMSLFIDTIAKMEDVPRDMIRLIFGGRNIHDEHKFLRDVSSLGEESTIQLVLRLRGC